MFGTNENWEQARDTEIQNIRNLTTVLGLEGITTHSFRAYMITRLSRKDPNFAKLLAGQKGYLLQYDRMSESEKLEKYLELENELLIDEYVDNANNKGLPSDKKRIEELELKMESVEELLKRVSKS